MLKECYPFSPKPLPYPYDSLEPYIDARTVAIHHGKHYQAYADNLNAALKDYPQYQLWNLEQLIRNCCILPSAIQSKVKNNAGGVYTHSLYFDNMGQGSSVPLGVIAQAIQKSFGTYSEFQVQFTKAALSVFGAGWAWLILSQCRELEIIQTEKQDIPLSKCLCPILVLDVWEHAYYLKYQNDRKAYIDAWFHVINWNKVDDNYLNCIYE